MVLTDKFLHPHAPPSPTPRPVEIAIIPFFLLYLFATHILGPIHVFQIRNQRANLELKQRKIITHPWWYWLLAIPLVAIHLSPIEGNARIPAVISFPLIWIMFVLCAWLTFLLTVIAIMNL
jgi:hypothetical protein